MLQHIEDHIHSPTFLGYVASQIYTNISMWLVHEVIIYFNMLPHVENQPPQWYIWWLKVTFFASFF